MNYVRNPNASDKIPVLISVNQLSLQKISIIESISRIFDLCGIKFSRQFAENILSEGNIVILIDGLDEARSDERVNIIGQINEIHLKYKKASIVTTVRTAAYEYWFEDFSHFEVASFTNDKINQFVKKWFGDQTSKSNELMRQLSANDQVIRMCSNPLIATIVCIAFDDGVQVVNNRVEIYKDAIESLLKRWDASRSVFRDNRYEKLSPKRREDLLRKLAHFTFSRGEVIFTERRARQVVDQYVSAIKDLTAGGDFDVLDIVRNIEEQHGLLEQSSRGLWKFAHLTFQEYFTAGFFCDQNSNVRDDLILKKYADPDWREVIILMFCLLPNADHCMLALLRSLTSIKYGDRFAQKILQDIRYAQNTSAYRQEHSDSIFDENLRHSAAATQDFLRLVDSEPDIDPEAAQKIVASWKKFVSFRFREAVFDKTWVKHWVFSNLFSLAKALGVSEKELSVTKFNVMSDKIVDGIYKQIKGHLEQLNEVCSVANFHQELTAHKDIAQSLVVRRNSLVVSIISSIHFEWKRVGLSIPAMVNERNKQVVKLLEVGVVNSVEQARDTFLRNRESLKALVAGDILAEVLKSAAYFTPPVRLAGLNALKYLIEHEPPRPPDDSYPTAHAVGERRSA